jgi:beta-N-acetylhexosaminidase
MTVSSTDKPTELRERLAQLLMVRIGSNLPPILRVHEDEGRIVQLLGDCHVGGLLLFNGTWPETRETLQRLQSQCKHRLLVASDIERGAGQQVAGLTLFPHQRAFVDIEDADAAIEEFCRTTASEAHAAGIDVTFGPVADVNSDPRNPIIATRAFGNDPHRAAELVAAYVRACEEAGLMTTAKHFPGHGDTHQDSHDATPRVEASLEELRQRELVPFQAAIDAGVSLIMTAHVEYPALDPSGLPATLSHAILVDLLRGEMGFEGVVCSDSLLMAGVRDRFETEGEMCLAALNAGVDLLLDVADPKSVVEAFVKAIGEGQLTTERVDEAFERVWRLKERAASRSLINLPTPESLAAGEAASLQIAGAATHVVSASPGALPLDRTKSLTCLMLKPHHRPTDPPEQPLAAALREQFAAVRYFETGPEIDPSLAIDLLAGCPEGSPIVVAMIVKPAAWHAFGLTEVQDRLIRELKAARPVILICLGVENALDAYPDAAARIVTHSDVAVSQRAVAGRLVG